MIPTNIILHHSCSSRDKTTSQNINAWHKARDFTLSSLGFYTGYHYLILGNGQIIQTRKDNEMGCHCVPNDGKIGICLTGNFEIEMSTTEQLISLGEILEKIKKDYGFTDDVIFGHCEKVRTACPGKNLMIWLKSYRQVSFLKRQITKLLELLKRLKVAKN